MDELSEEDKVLVGRARRIEKFLVQNFIVAEKFTGQPGSVVPLEETIEAFDRSARASSTTCPSRRSSSAVVSRTAKKAESWRQD